MRLALDRCRRANWFTFALALLIATTHTGEATAGDLEIRVRDREGHGVEDVVVVAHPTGSAKLPPAQPAEAIMDQQKRKFVPQVLVVRTGTVVAFPNNDTVSHQVYSFSPARRFQLALYKGEAHPPLTFDAPGLVVLGCNIHDEMVGYIYVTDSPYFARTGADGSASIRGLPAGTYRLEAWGPRVADPPEALARTVRLEATGDVVADWRLTRPLRPRPSPGPRDVDWDY
jgi:plastocyanin